MLLPLWIARSGQANHAVNNFTSLVATMQGWPEGSLCNIATRNVA